MPTFDEAFKDFHLTPEERKALVWRLAAIRTQKLIETLLPEPKDDGLRQNPEAPETV